MKQETLGDFKDYSLAGTDQEIQFITDTLQLPVHSKILDLYCGYGRHSLELAKQEYQVIGLDSNREFLAIARQKAAELNIQVDFVERDMRQLDYQSSFDAVINMFAAFGYFSDEENAAVIQKIAQSLKSQGLLLMDLFNRDWMLRNNVNRYWRHPSGKAVLSYKVEIEQGIAVMKRQLINQVTGEKTEADFQLRAYSLAEMTEMLNAAKLSVQNVFGAFDGRDYDRETPRLIILAQKN